MTEEHRQAGLNRSERRAEGQRGPKPSAHVPTPAPAAGAARVVIEEVGVDSPDVAAWRERIRIGRAGHHGLNAYKCPRCGLVTMTIDVDPGVTPMFLGCRRTPDCTGYAESAMYPDSTPPANLLEHLDWEWAMPAPTDRLDSRIVEHVRRGGLVLRPRTDRPSAYVHTADGQPLTIADRPTDLDNDRP